MGTLISSWLCAVTYCAAAAIVGLFVGAVGGVGVASLLMKQEEANILVAGVVFGGPSGALLGFVLGVVAIRRSFREKACAQALRTQPQNVQ